MYLLKLVHVVIEKLRQRSFDNHFHEHVDVAFKIHISLTSAVSEWCDDTL